MERQETPTDILRLFKEDLNPIDRVDAFRRAAEQIRTEVDQLATAENIERINENFRLTFVFNSHGNAVDAGQSISVIKDPFITFVESAGDADLHQNTFFEASVNNAFDTLFNNQAAMKPPFPLTRENGWPYWRDRGLFANSSIIAPIDIRHYSRRLLDALMGSDYDQGYLNSSISQQEIQSKPFEQMVEDQVIKGELIMLSNAVREMTSTKQILETMLYTLNPHGEHGVFSSEIADKIRALCQKRRDTDEKLNTYVIYGSAHHAIMHVFRGLGIPAERRFPGKDDMPGNFSTIGSIKDQFFAAHPFGLNEEQKKKYATEYILESILWAPLNRPAEYGVVPADDHMYKDGFYNLARIARKLLQTENAHEIYDQFSANPDSAVRLLQANGVKLRSPDQPN